MSATESNPKFHGALSLVELVPGMAVCAVNIEEKSYVDVTVVQVDIRDDVTIRLACGDKQEQYPAKEIGVIPSKNGSWTVHCLCTPDNSALEEFENMTPAKIRYSPWHPHRTLTCAWYSFEKDDGR